jgi:actin cytoskeleton-regulatory complex protein SLA1
MAYVSLCKALYDYTATAEDELTFTEDALLYVLDAEDAEWWKAKLKVGENETDEDDEGPIGLIPANYVEESEPVRISKALYDYAKQNEDELDIEEDEMLSVFEIKGEWLLVKKQNEGIPSGQLGFVPANYVDEVAAVDGVTEPMEAAPLEEHEPESYSAPATAIPIATSTATIGAPRKVAKDDEIKMWAASELDAKKKKKKGTLGIGNSSLFFASESDKAPVQKINVLSIISHTIEGKGKQLNLELDAQAAASVNVDENNNLRFVLGSKGDVEEVWKKIEVSQEKAHAANAEPEEEEEEIAPPAAAAIPAPPPIAHSTRSVPSAPIPPPAPPAASILPPPSRATAVPKPPSAPSAPTPASNGLSAGEENAIALYDFDAQGDDELTVAENESLILVEKETDDWWKVRNASGQEGVVPASYVEVVADHGVDQVASRTAALSVADEEDHVEARAAAEASARAREEEERQRQEEEEEAAERARLQEERRAKADAQRRAREAEERRREALKSQPAPKPPRAPATTATTSASAASRDVSIPSGRSAPARPKDAGKSKPSPARTRIWHDRTGQFKVEAEFLGFNQGKIRLHKLNGVVIEVAIEKMSQPDIQYLEEVTGRKLAPSRSSRSNGTRSGTNGASASDGRSERDRERRREQEREQRRRQEAAKGPKRNIDWFEFFLASGVDIDDCTRYASAFERDKIDEAILPELDSGTLRSIGLREGDIIRVTKFISKRYNKGAAAGSGSRSNDPASQIKADEALARKLQEQEQAAKRNGTTPPPNLFSGPDGSLKNNTRRGRPNANPTRNTSGTVDAASLAAASESLARTSSPPMRSNNASPEVVRSQPTASTTSGFDDDAWTPRPPSAKPATPVAAAPTPPPQPPRPTSAAASASAPAPAVSPAPPAPSAPVPATTPEVKADPNSALFDKLAAMKPSTPSGGRPGASPLGTGSMFNGPRGPFAPVASNQSMLQPLIPTQSTGQFMPTSLGHQPTGMGMQPQQTGWGGMQQMMPQQTGYMQAQQTGYGMQMSQPQSPFGMNAMVSQPTGFSAMMSPPIQQQGQQPLAPQYTQQQYSQQQQQQKQQEINNGPDRFSAANIFGQMKQGTMHQDTNQAPQNSQKYDALRPQPTGFQPGGYINTQFTGYNGGGYGYQ